MSDTLYDRAFSQDGSPIPRDQVVKVELIDSHGTVVETRDFTREDDADELLRYAGEYALSMAAEGMSGNVRWSGACDPEESG